MKFFKGMGPVYVLMVISGLLFGTLIYQGIKKEGVCDELVTFNDGTQYEVTEVLSYRNGMSTIKQCNGHVFRTPTLNIKMVEELKK